MTNYVEVAVLAYGLGINVLVNYSYYGLPDTVRGTLARVVSYIVQAVLIIFIVVKGPHTVLWLIGENPYIITTMICILLAVAFHRVFLNRRPSNAGDYFHLLSVLVLWSTSAILLAVS